VAGERSTKRARLHRPITELDFSEEEIRRYSRHIGLPEVGGIGQKQINQASVLVVGAGGLGSPVAFYVAAAGVGKIGIVDSDVVDISNLQRQILHTTADIGRKKVDRGRCADGLWCWVGSRLHHRRVLLGDPLPRPQRLGVRRGTRRRGVPRGENPEALTVVEEKRSAVSKESPDEIRRAR
jgi:hypothetical protein